ncbi:MAG TPA: ShlB/FhaC/HecB family hemolysin secretion/activation protein [Caulobacteraceae bacterium]
MVSALIAAAVSSGYGHAQVASGQGPARERTGPNAQPPPLPSFAVPKRELPSLPSAPPPLAADRGETVLFSEVRIDQGGGRFMARPARAWRPAINAADVVRLYHRRRENLDAAWVHRQFARNQLVGVETTPDRVVALVLLINRAFAQNGYINTGLLLPRQGWPARGGVLDLQLVAGRVVPLVPGGPAIAVTWAKKGSQGLSADYVRARMSAASRWPLDAAAVEQQFRLLADDPAIRTINARLAPGPRAGEAILAIIVDPQPRFDLYATLANSRSPSVGGDRAAVGGSIRNALIAGDVVGGEYGLTSGLADGSIVYSAPVFGTGSFIDARAAFDDAAVVDENLRALNIRSSESSFEIGLSDRLVDTPLTPNALGDGWRPARSLTVGIHLEHRLSTSTLLGQPFSFSPGAVNGRTELNVLRGALDWVERGERQVIAASATASLGVNGTESSVPDLPTPDPNFTTILVQLNYARRLGAGGLEFRARAAGQWASGLLYSMERFSVGGQESVRGYRENLLLADSGVLGSVELSCPVGAGRGWCAGRSEDWRTVRISVFVDGAAVHNEVAPQPDPKSIASVGFALAWTPSAAVSTRLIFAQALVKAPVSGVADLQDRGVAFQVIVHPLGYLLSRPSVSGN